LRASRLAALWPPGSGGPIIEAVSSTPDCGSETPTCDDCFFRRELLCALAGNTICPTFRAAGKEPVLYTVLSAPERERKPVAA
jgi:hypothetical protein